LKTVIVRKSGDIHFCLIIVAEGEDTFIDTLEVDALAGSFPGQT
jgi:hypothetical protein